jgi:NTE family protein
MKNTFNKQNNKKTVSLGLALQGGGSYGSFTKGVLIALLESDLVKDDIAKIKTVTGTSAGAINGALLTYGLNSGSKEKAIECLNGLWSDVGDQGKEALRYSTLFNFFSFSKWPNLPESMLIAGRTMVSKGFILEQLKNNLDKQIDNWGTVQKGPTKLYINAVKEDSQTKNRSHIVFSGKDITSDTVTASGALEIIGPKTINGEHFYDGAYWRNPCFSDIKKENITDLLVITLQPHPSEKITAKHQDVLRNGHKKPGKETIGSEIHHHLAHLHQENPNLNLHVISLNVNPSWNYTSRLNAHPDWLKELEKKGYEAGQKWLSENADKIGKKSTYITPCYKKPDNNCDCSP